MHQLHQETECHSADQGNTYGGLLEQESTSNKSQSGCDSSEFSMVNCELKLSSLDIEPGYTEQSSPRQEGRGALKQSRRTAVKESKPTIGMFWSLIRSQSPGWLQNQQTQHNKRNENHRKPPLTMFLAMSQVRLPQQRDRLLRVCSASSASMQVSFADSIAAW
jgi:hypothetical protein